ncbi:MAG TPA: sulfatase-like hydrolase/transferase, partial [Terriglobales bacterium]
MAVKAQWLKYGGFAAAAAAMNRTWETTESFSRLQRLGFYHGDLLVTGCLLPLLLIAMLYRVARKWAVLLATVVSILAASTLLTQYSAFSMLGRFADWTVIRTGLQWWIENPSSGSDALVRSYELRLACVVIAIVLLGVAAYSVVPRLSEVAKRWTVRLIALSLCVSALLGMIGWSMAAQAPLFSRDTLVATAGATLGLDASSLDKSVFAMTPQQQFKLYRRIANTPVAAPDSYFGRAAGFNLLMFVFETTPTRVVDPARESLEDFPNLQRLRDRSLVASEHFTTFPATNLATFAMFSSMYSSEHIGDSVQRPFPALMNILAQSGYDTGFYGYVWKGAGDDAMLRNLGFRKLINSELASTFFERMSEGQLGLEQRIKRDIGPLEQLERDI